uniref:Secreted protein 2 n=1 Tax=Rhipicephalus microplus TaxID=6941 RepID=A0A034WWM8_RHIMP|nr:uncharacterized protein LOC119185496 [Rhipicephalus microplus]
MITRTDAQPTRILPTTVPFEIGMKAQLLLLVVTLAVAPMALQPQALGEDDFERNFRHIIDSTDDFFQLDPFKLETLTQFVNRQCPNATMCHLLCQKFGSLRGKCTKSNERYSCGCAEQW